MMQKLIGSRQMNKATVDTNDALPAAQPSLPELRLT
jgi:hypothetical protein